MSEMSEIIVELGPLSEAEPQDVQRNPRATGKMSPTLRPGAWIIARRPPIRSTVTPAGADPDGGDQEEEGGQDPEVALAELQVGADLRTDAPTMKLASPRG